MNHNIPTRQAAVQLTGADELVLNTSKSVHMPGPYQILCRVEAVSLCFSDLKLLKQFSSHARKGKIISGISGDILKEIPSYVPGEQPTVPGHESVVRVCAVGDKVQGINVGGRYLVQTDYRWLPTKNSCASFGYNFEGALQEYVLMDQRVVTSPEGESFLIPAGEELSASAIALVEPWACVEDAYSVKERKNFVSGGQMLIVAENEISQDSFRAFINRYGRPAKITLLSKSASLPAFPVSVGGAEDIERLEDAFYDDVVYFGSNCRTAEALFGKVSSNGLFNIVLCGGRFGRGVSTQIGRVHYGNIRIIGTSGSDAAESMRYIPSSGEIRTGEAINVIGAGGPMGVMHVIRNISQGVKEVAVFAGDIDNERLALLSRIAVPLAEKNKVSFRTYNSAADDVKKAFSYVVIMAPVPKLVADSVKGVAEHGIINIFAGIPAEVAWPIDLDAYIEKHLYFIGTSGSTLADMKTVLSRIENGSLDTNLSVAVISGLEGAVDGIRAVENRLVSGKIIVYPSCRELPLVALDELQERYPEVAAKLSDGCWTKEAEDAILKAQKKSDKWDRLIDC
ncbi:MAG: alcohol dehydrogenase catalytic domain-containing protein [Planctomycetota bacterium]|jgi:threonine dehydrogenase-like Zn-dependent dehydrogenase